MGGSTSQHSINKQLAVYASTLLKNSSPLVLDLNDYNCPLYSIDIEKQTGFPEAAKAFVAAFKGMDGLIISVAEHNANITAALKNILDWASRIEINFLAQVPVLLLSTSPGGYGGQNAQKIASTLLPKLGALIQDTFALPKFKDNFIDGSIINTELDALLREKVMTFENIITQ